MATIVAYSALGVEIAYNIFRGLLNLFFIKRIYQSTEKSSLERI